MTALSRLSAALAGKPQPAQSPPEPLKPLPARVAPSNPVPPPPAPALVTSAPVHPHGPRLVTATVAGIERTLSLTGWAAALRLDRATLAYRLNRGWSPAQALGLEPPPPRNRGAEQAASAITHSRVVLVEDVGGVTRVIPRAEAARRLGIQPRSLTHRLRRYRPADGSTARLSFSVLQG